MVELIRDTQDEQHAIVFLKNHLVEKPSLKGVFQMLEMSMSEENSVTSNIAKSDASDMNIVKTMVEKLLYDKPVYQCVNCGFSGKESYWLCPSCKQWESVQSIKGLEGE